MVRFDPHCWDSLEETALRVHGEVQGSGSGMDVVAAMADYTENELTVDPHCRVGHVARHMLHLFHGEPGARQWRRSISENAFGKHAGPSVLIEALEARQNH